MPKRKSLNGRQVREKDRERKRRARQTEKAVNGMSDAGSSVPGGSEDGAIAAPPGNFLGKVSMGFPLKEEKPLARVQASLREKMHPPAPRLPSPRGSRLFVQKGKAPSPDSSPWVCAPPRAPGPDPVHGSGPAGQAQLEGFREERTSRNKKDEGNLKETKTETERNMNRNLNLNKNNIFETMYDNENNISESTVSGEDKETRKRNLDVGNQNNAIEGKFISFHSVQGSFHQADNLFEDNAGTQCVANCLAGLSFHKLKNAVCWTVMDMNRILMTGDELYTFLQRSSSIRDRFLLVEELPELFECFNRSYKFRSNNELTSVILPNANLDYADFNALPLDEALQIALDDTDGCFICFGGNTMLIGKSDNHFFTFDSHARNMQGMQSSTGKSTRVMHENTNQLLQHIQNLALSMGYTQNVECNLTGVYCHMSAASSDQVEVQNDVHNSPDLNEVELIADEDVSIVNFEEGHFTFLPLNVDVKKGLCQKLNVPYIRYSTDMLSSQQTLSKPSSEKKIVGDGNCFFRAMSFSVTNTEDYYYVMRNAVCTHLNQNQELFKPFLRDNVKSVKNHLLSSRMSENGTWATEVEILAMAHLLNVEIYTYTRSNWLRFSPSDVDSSTQGIVGAIYLNHCGENHYNVVVAVESESVDLLNTLSKGSQSNLTTTVEKEEHFEKSDRVQVMRAFSKFHGKLSAARKRRQSLKQKYKDDEEFRKKKLRAAFNRYKEDEDYQINAKVRNKDKYLNDYEHNKNMKLRSIQKYAEDDKHRENLKRRSMNRYADDEEHQRNVKLRSIKKYADDENHRKKVKIQSVEKYAVDEEHKKNVKTRSVEKYAVDEEHKRNVKMRSVEKYAVDEEHKRNVKTRSVEKYAVDEEHKRNVKMRSVEKYAVDEEHKRNVKTRSVEKYAVDEEHKRNVKTRSVEKYAVDEEHKKNVKMRSVEKYAVDEDHKRNVKMQSVKKYATDDKHREDVKRRSKVKYATDEVHRHVINTASSKRYREDKSFREGKLLNSAERYKTDKSFQTKGKAYSKKRYDSSSTVKKMKKANVSKRRNMQRIKLENEDEVVKIFKEKAMQGIDYSCCCCERLLFENQVKKCDRESYLKSMNASNVADLCIQDKFCHECSEFCPKDCTKYQSWICYTCHRKIMSGNIPEEASFNNMAVEEIPKELNELNYLEKHLIGLHIPFMKVMALPHGGQKNIHGPVVCVPSDLKKVTKLPIKADENMLLRVKLKRKLNYKGYFEYQFVNPTHIRKALDFLKRNNQWYENNTIDNHLDENLTEIQAELVESQEESLQEELQNDVQQIAIDTCLQPVDIAQEVLDHYFDEIYDIAPGEGNNPVRMLQEPGNEAKTFPYLFPSGRFSWNERRETRITLSRYFNNRLMNSDDRFAKDSSYLFFSQFMSDLNQVIEKTQISIRKCLYTMGQNSTVTSSMIQDPEVLSKLMKSDEALRFMQPIRGTPAYWSSAQKDLFAMLRQLGIPTWFCSFSAAEHRWNDAVASILKNQGDNRDPCSLDWAEKNEVLRSNPVTVARMFEHRFHVFQSEVIFSPAEPIGKVTDHFQRVEFQQRGSPHMHCLYWVENAPKLDQDGENAVCDFVDRYVSCGVPSEDDDSELRNTVQAVQQHSKNHSKSCRKKGTECRFNFPRPPSIKTFINTPHEEESDDISCLEAVDSKQKQLIAKELLIRVWNEIEDESRTTEEIFNELNVTQDEYEDAHKRLAKKRSIVLERNPNELWINQYNPCLLKCWDANMDIQFVLDPFSCIVYIISYISKSEREMGMLLKQTKIEAEEGNESARTTLKKIGSAYLNHREVSAQEAVYRVCNLKMKECSRKVVFIPVGENTTRLTKPLSQLKRGKTAGKNENDEIDDEDDESDIWMTNIVERYENRPDEPLFQSMCLGKFCSEFRVLAKSQIPATLNENVFKLQNSKGYIQRRTRTKPAIIRYPRFNAEKMPEKYYQSLLQLFLPHWTRSQLKPPGFDLYQTFYENGHIRIKGESQVRPVKEIVDTNHAIFAENEDVLAEAREVYENIGEPEDAWANLCPESEVMRQQCTIPKLTLEGAEELPDMQDDMKPDVLYKVKQNSHSRDDIMPVLQSLNETQMKVFYHLREWCLQKVAGQNPDPFHIFITGGAGTGKSHLIKAIHYEASRILSKTLSAPDGVSVLLSAFTGTAAFNIGGNTLHHLFSLSKFMPLPYEPLKEQSLSEMRVQLGDLQILIIDEVSMVYKKLLFYVHERLVQIKKCKQPFGGVSVIAVGDFYQLPPVKQRKDERLYQHNAQYPVDYWVELFKVIELTEIMRQREDIPFARALNSLRSRVGQQPMDEETKNILKDCVREGPEDALHVYSTNEEVNDYNLHMLRRTCDELVEIDAQDFTRDSSSGKLTPRNKPLTKSKTDSLCSCLLLGINAKVMLTRNCNVDDGLVNGVIGNVSRFVLGKGSAANTVLAVEVIFDNRKVGNKTGKRTRNGNLVLIERVQEDIQGQKSKSVVRHQFPLKLSWACTAHKVQGMTVKQVVVNLDRSFSAGQGYVALSRVTSKEGLFIETSDIQTLQKKFMQIQK
ncbi:uncharacterized protein LOC111105212 [Crassostrea virginica]